MLQEIYGYQEGELMFDIGQVNGRQSALTKLLIVYPLEPGSH